MTSHKGTPPQVALIGVSGYATVYVNWLLEAHGEEHLEVVAVCALPADQNLPAVQRFRELEAKIYESYEDLFRAHHSQIDLCLIPTGIQWHARITLSALRAGCNVLVEKPLAGSIADVEAIQQAERDTGKWVAVGYQDMYTDELDELKQQLTSGIIGQIETVAMLGAWPRPESYYLRNTWAGKLHADGAQVLDSPLNNAFAHFVNLSLYLASPNRDQSSDVKIETADLYRAHHIESFDTAVVTARSPQGTLFWLGVSHACQSAIEPTIRITGSAGHISWTREDHWHIKANGQPTRSRPLPNYIATRTKMFDKVLARLEDPQAQICSTAIARCQTHLIEQIHKLATIQTADPAQIERVTLSEANSSIPTIRSIETRLQTAFEKLEPLSDLAPQTTKA